MRGVVGCIISNELVDSLPVHRFQVVDGEVAEIFVGLDDQGGLVEIPGPPSTPDLSRRVEGLGFPLSEGFRGEVNLEAARWLAQVAASLERGFVLTFDYGREAHDLYSPARAGGTVRTYRGHAPAGSPLDRLGRQDITADVDFSLLSTEGSRLGLRTLSLQTQERFLTGARLRPDDGVPETRPICPRPSATPTPWPCSSWWTPRASEDSGCWCRRRTPTSTTRRTS